MDLAYLAGFVDGEGTIGLRKYRRKDRDAPQYEPYMAVGNTDPLVPTWFHGIFGGSYRQRKTTVGGRAKPYIYVWEIGAKSAVSVAHMLRPYLRMKRPQATLLIEEFQESRLPAGRRSYSSEQWAHLESLYQRMKRLNWRGVPPDEGADAPSASGAPS